MPRDILITPKISSNLETRLNKLANNLDWLLDNPTQGPKPIAQTGILEQIGSDLWEASRLSQQQLLEALEQARDEEKPVRLIISGPAFQHLPWELLYHGHDDLGFLARHPWCVVTRSMKKAEPKSPTLLPKPVRLLLFIASPEDLNSERSRLDFEKEEELLFTALDEPLARGDVEIDVAEDGAFQTLYERLERQQYHAVVLSMHGAETQNNKGKSESGLLFEHSETGKSAPMAGSELAAEFERLPRGHRPSLVVLSACRSAKAEESAESLASVTRALHERGFERVLGMRLSVQDKAASVFSTELFRQMAMGEEVGRAVGFARHQVAKGEWIQSGDGTGKGSTIGDVFAQWSLPVLFDRTTDGPLVDPKEARKPERSQFQRPTVLIGDGTIHLPDRRSFIGRRTQIRQHLRAFVDGTSPRIMLTGPGGVGKTTLAGQFAGRFFERQPDARLLGFQAPFDLSTMFEPIRKEAFDGTEESDLLEKIKTEKDPRKKLSWLLHSLATRTRPCLFVLDNVESIQKLETLEVSPDHQDSLWFLQEICALPSPARVLLTGRYAFPEIPQEKVQEAPVPDAPYGDVLQRMNRLTALRGLKPEEKYKVYKVLGGNHRGLEWLNQILGESQEKAKEVVEALERVKAPPKTPEQALLVVLSSMRENLVFDVLRQQLTPAQNDLLCAASLYRVPVNDDGLRAIDSQPDQAEGNWTRLVEYALLERAHDPSLNLEYFFIPPVVKGLLGGPGFSLKVRQNLHKAMGCYHRFQGEHVSRRWSDNLEAVFHFRQAGEHEAADVLAEGIAGFYYRISNFAEANALAEEIVKREEETPQMESIAY